ncbi:Uncharacterized protein SCF082_LOCUS48408 [Durusdinium trenchii]
MVLARNYCNLLGRCTENLPLVELLKRHLLPSALALNELNKFPHFSAAETLEKEFQSLAQVESGIRRAHILMCSEPPFFCQMFRGLGKPIFGYIGNPFGAYLRPGHPQENFYKVFRDELVVNPRNSFACMSPYLGALIYWHSGVHVPVVRPLGLYTGASYQPLSAGRFSRSILVTKSIFVPVDLAMVLNDFVAALRKLEEKALVPLKLWESNHTLFANLKQLSDPSWSNWARHTAAVFLPYDPQQMVFYELYSMGVPLLVPHESLLPFLIRLGYTNLQEFRYQSPGWEVPREARTKVSLEGGAEVCAIQVCTKFKSVLRSLRQVDILSLETGGGYSCD